MSRTPAQKEVLDQMTDGLITLEEGRERFEKAAASLRISRHSPTKTVTKSSTATRSRPRHGPGLKSMGLRQRRLPQRDGGGDGHGNLRWRR